MQELQDMVWKYWKNEAMKQEEVTNGYLVGKAMKGYITDMVVAQAYAEYNHLVIDQLVLEAIPDLKFYVTQIGCGIAGFKVAEIAPLFQNAFDVANIILPKEFVEATTMDNM